MLCNGNYVDDLQYHEGVRAMWLAEKAGNIYHHPYNLGVYENLISVRTIFHTSFLELFPKKIIKDTFVREQLNIQV